jgi:hypothetical protein
MDPIFMIKIIAALFIASQVAVAGLPPTSTKGSADANPVTTFRFDFPNVNITHTGTTASILAGDFSSNTATSVDSELVLFSGTTGKVGKRATGTGYAKVASGVFSAQSTPLPSADLNGGRTINAQTGTTYQFVLADGSMSGGFPLVTLDNASAITATVPANATVAFPVGTQIDVSQLGAGTVTITPAGGVTVNTSSGSLVMAQYSGATLVKVATDTWNFYQGAGTSAITALTGDVTATGPGSVAATIANLAVTGAKIANSTIDLSTKLTAALLPQANMPATATSAIAASDVDWATLKNLDGLYTKTLAANTTLTFSNVSAGQTIVIAITNTASNYTVTWPAAAKWSGGTAPTQTIGAKTDVYTCKAYDATNAYCVVVANY